MTEKLARATQIWIKPDDPSHPNATCFDGSDKTQDVSDLVV